MNPDDFKAAISDEQVERYRMLVFLALAKVVPGLRQTDIVAFRSGVKVALHFMVGDGGYIDELSLDGVALILSGDANYTEAGIDDKAARLDYRVTDEDRAKFRESMMPPDVTDLLPKPTETNGEYAARVKRERQSW